MVKLGFSDFRFPFRKKTPPFQESNNYLELFSICIEVVSILAIELVLSGGTQPLSQKQSTKQIVIIESFSNFRGGQQNVHAKAFLVSNLLPTLFRHINLI